jgi:hypothetical protein
MAYSRYHQQAQYHMYEEVGKDDYQSFLIDWEGLEGIEQLMDEDTGFGQHFAEIDLNSQKSDHWFIDFEYSGEKTIAILQDQAVFHAITGEDIVKKSIQESSTFTFDRYSSETFQGIIPDSGAAGVSTAGHPQFLALQKLDPSVQLDTSTAGNHNIHFGKGSSLSEGTIWVATPFGIIPFQVVSENTPFLLCLWDMDRLSIRFDNLHNELIQGKKRVPIICRWGHPFLLLHQPEQSMAYHHLTETELRQLHC